MKRMKSNFFTISVVLLSVFVFKNTAHAKWQQTNNLLKGTTWPIQISSFAVINKSVYAGSSDGLFQTDDNGKTWTQIDNNPNSSKQINALVVSDKTLFAGFDGDKGVCKLNNDFPRWSECDSGLPTYSNVYSLATSGNSIFAGVVDAEDADAGVIVGGIYHSDNKGLSWTESNSGLPDSTIITALAAKDNTIYAGTFDRGIYQSTDNGATWKALNNGLPEISFVTSIAIKEDKIFAVAYNLNGDDHLSESGIFISTDNGDSWSLSYEDDYNLIYSLYIVGNNILAGGGFYGMGNKNILAYQFIFGTIINAGDGFNASGSILQSNDDGKTWEDIDQDLNANSPVYCFAQNGDYLFAGTDSGRVYRKPMSEVASIKYGRLTTNHSNSEMSIKRNNTQIVNIDFTLSFPEEVSFTVCTASGRALNSIAKKEFTSGHHTLSWNTQTIPNGCYFVRMQSKTRNASSYIVLSR